MTFILSINSQFQIEKFIFSKKLNNTDVNWVLEDKLNIIINETKKNYLMQKSWQEKAFTTKCELFLKVKVF